MRAAVRSPGVAVGVAVAVIVLSWILATPRSAGPDEPSHNVRAGALVRGDLDGERLRASVFHDGFRLPAEIGFPDPVCFAFDPDVPATCASDLPVPTGEELLGTKSADYPIWGHVLPGLGTFASGEGAAWGARLFDAIVPVALVTAALLIAGRRGSVGAGATLLALTPMAWFMFAVVNPSGLVIAGGIGLWAALLAPPGRDRAVGWLAAASWAALVLPRRDGLLWAALILAFALLITSSEPRELWSRWSPGARAVVVLATLATLAWAARSDTNAVKALFLVPLAPVGAVLARGAWRRLPQRPLVRASAVGAVASVGAVVVVALALRISDVRRGFLRLVIGLTGDDITEAIGVLGWLDTPVPTSVLYLWFVALGLLVGAAAVADRRDLLLGAAAIVAVAIPASWALTLVQTDDFVNYWQGRYYLPLLVGVPMLFGRLELAAGAQRRVGVAAAAASMTVVNVGLAAMIRRYAVGRSGSMLPWDWDTYRSPLPPVALLVVHVLASAVLVGWAWRLSPTAERRQDR